MSTIGLPGTVPISLSPSVPTSTSPPHGHTPLNDHALITRLKEISKMFDFSQPDALSSHPLTSTVNNPFHTIECSKAITEAFKNAELYTLIKDRALYEPRQNIILQTLQETTRHAFYREVKAQLEIFPPETPTPPPQRMDRLHDILREFFIEKNIYLLTTLPQLQKVLSDLKTPQDSELNTKIDTLITALKKNQETEKNLDEVVPPTVEILTNMADTRGPTSPPLENPQAAVQEGTLNSLYTFEASMKADISEEMIGSLLEVFRCKEAFDLTVQADDNLQGENLLKDVNELFGAIIQKIIHNITVLDRVIEQLVDSNPQAVDRLKQILEKTQRANKALPFAIALLSKISHPEPLPHPYPFSQTFGISKLRDIKDSIPSLHKGAEATENPDVLSHQLALLLSHYFCSHKEISSESYMETKAIKLMSLGHNWPPGLKEWVFKQLLQFIYPEFFTEKSVTISQFKEVLQ
jgi:hypothetical protein